jgi:hypothetical protein
MRKIKDTSLFYEYKTDSNVKKFVKMLVALSFVNHYDLVQTFFDIKLMNDFPQQLHEIYNYFYYNYINGEANGRYEVTLLNNVNVRIRNIPKTNNAIEGWHSVFKNCFGSC